MQSFQLSFSLRLRRVQRWSVLWPVVLLAACQTMPHDAEMQSFRPLPPEQRVMSEVKLRWLVREDVAQYCARAIQMGQEQAYITPPVACAVWDKAAQECTIVTGTKVSHVALGHEVRHCFEGHFHR
jgi:hypothetical protein